MSMQNFIRRYGRNLEHRVNILKYDRFEMKENKEICFYKNGKKDMCFIYDYYNDLKKEIDEINNVLDSYYSSNPSKKD